MIPRGSEALGPWQGLGEVRQTDRYSDRQMAGQMDRYVDRPRDRLIDGCK